MGVQKFKFKANRPSIVGDTNIKPYWKVIEEIIESSDIILEVIDARMVSLSRNEDIEEMVKAKGKKLIFILNKTDIAPSELVNKQAQVLRNIGEVFTISAKDMKSISKLRTYLLAESKKKEFMRVGVLGYPNTGKSSIINALVRRKRSPVTSRAGTTHGQQWVKMNDNLRIVDSPGVIPLKQSDELRYALIGSKNPEKIKNLEFVLQEIIKILKDSDNLEKLYKIKIESEDINKIIEDIGRRFGYLKKGNEVDETRVAIKVIRDWQSGKLRI